MGLAICEKIIKEHSGRLDVESEVGKGKYFLRLSSPFFKGNDTMNKTSLISWSWMTILSPSTFLKEVLTKEGYQVDTALSGEEAIARGMDHFFDIVITDVRMGDKDGMEVLRVL